MPHLFEREDDPLYPPAALREAMANAICHRDYAMGGGSIGVAIYDDRLEITSSGVLHFGLTIDDLFRPHESLPWNPVIASVFYRRGLIEAWGRGTLKMLELTQQAGLPSPEIEESSSTIIVRFRPSRVISEIGRTITTRQRDILQRLQSGKALALRELHRMIEQDATLRSVREDLAVLKRLGLIDSRGHGRGAGWFSK